jgi:hypothetical protein
MGNVDLDTLIERIELHYDADELVDLLDIPANEILTAFRWRVEMNRENFNHLERVEDYLEMMND